MEAAPTNEVAVEEVERAGFDEGGADLAVRPSFASIVSARSTRPDIARRDVLVSDRRLTRRDSLAQRVASARERHRGIELHRWLSSILIMGVLAMIPWTTYLAVSLPVRFRAHNWNVAWVGFDSALIVVLALTAWAAWYRRQILAATAIVAATMLLCDAWFDVSTSIGTKDEYLTILTALLANVPMATFFLWLARRIILRTAAVLASALHTGPAPRHAHDVTLPFVAPAPSVVDGSPPDRDYRAPSSPPS